MRIRSRIFYATFIVFFALVFSNTAFASGLTMPAAITYYANLSISNSQSSATVNGMQMMVSFNALGYQGYEAGSLNNIEFFYTNNGTTVPSWMEGNQLNWYQPANTLYTSANVIFWIKYGPSIAGHSTTVNAIAVGFASKTTDLLNRINIGEAPQLSCPNPANTILCNYGEYDDGSKVFNRYWNFSNSNTWYKGGPGYGPAGIEYVDNGMRVQGWTFDNVQGITTTGNVITALVNATGYSGTVWGGALILSNSSSGSGFGDYPGVGSIMGAYTYSPVIYLYQGEYVTNLQLGSNITDLNAPHTISIGFNSSSEINYTSINYGSSIGSETSNVLALFPSGYYNQGPLDIGPLACTNFTIASPHAKIKTNSIDCSGKFSNNGLLYAGTGGESCQGGSGAGNNGRNCTGSLVSFGGSGGAGGGNSTLGLIGGYGGNTLAKGGIGTTGVGGNGAAAPAPSIIDASNVALWGSAPSTYLSSGGGGAAANGGGNGEGASSGLFIEAGNVNAGNIITGPAFTVPSGGGGAGGSSLLIAYGNGGYTAGSYNLSGNVGGAAGSGWASGGNGGSGQLITYDYGSNPVPVNINFPKQATAYPILASFQGNASYYYLYSRYMPPLGKMPSVSFSSTHLTPFCTAVITNPSNAIMDIGQYETFTVSEDNCTGPYTYNILVSSDVNPSVITNDYLVTGSSSNSITYTLQTNSLDQSNSPEVANVIVTSSSSTVASAYSPSFYINPALSFVSISSSPTLPATEDTGNTVILTASISGGSSPYTYNFLIYNITTGSLIGNYLASSLSASNTVSWQIPYSVGNNALEVNAIVSDGSDGGAETVNSAYIKPLYTKSVISITNVSPDSCIAQGGCVVTVNGTGFFNSTTVDFGSVSSNSVNITNSTSMHVVVPTGVAEQNVSVSVQNKYGVKAIWNRTFNYGYTFIADNFTNNLNFTGWNETGTCCVTGGTLYTVTGGQTTFDNTITPTPIYGTHEAMIWYPFRQGIVDINGTEMTLVSGDPFGPSSTGIYLGGYYGMVTNNASILHWLYGSKFNTSGSWINQNITIFEESRRITSVTNSTQMILNYTAGGNTGYFIPDKWWEGFYHKISSCASSTECTLTQNLGVEKNMPYTQGSDDLNNDFGQGFQTNRPTTMFVRGYVYFQAPTNGGPFGQRKVYYLKEACGGATNISCGGEAYILSSYASDSNHGTVNINGTSVNWVSGQQFSTDSSWNGKGILIDGKKNYSIASVTNSTHLTLTSSAGVQSNITYSSLVSQIGLSSGIQSGFHNNTLYDSAHGMQCPCLNFNQWYEIQIQVVLNTPGQANGYFNVWINGQYRPDLSAAGVDLRNVSGIDQGWQWVEIGRQLDAGDANNSRIAWENEYRFWDAVSLSNAYLPSPVQLKPLSMATTTTYTTTSTTVTTSTSTTVTTSTATTVTTTASGNGNVGGGGGGAAPGGGGSSLPTVLPYNTTSDYGWKVLNFSQDDSENVKINGRLFGITLNSISPKSADVTINGASYALDLGTQMAIGGGYFLNLSYVSYLPIIDTVTLELYANSSKTSTSSNSSTKNYNVSISLNSSSFPAGSSHYITAYVENQTDTVAVYANGVLEAEGKGTASFNIDVLAKGNYTLQACDISISPRSCSSTEKLSILAPVTTIATTISAVATTGQGPSNSSGNYMDYVLIVIAVIAIGIVVDAMLRYRNKRLGNDGSNSNTSTDQNNEIQQQVDPPQVKQQGDDQELPKI